MFSLGSVLDAAARLTLRRVAQLAPAIALATIALALAGPRWTPLVLAAEAPIALAVAAPSWRIALSRAGAVLAVIALVSVVAIGLGLALVAPALGSDADPTATLVVFALWLSAVLVLYTRWLVAVPTMIHERPGIVGALRRSGALTTGRRGPIAAMLLLMAAVFVLAMLAVDALASVQESRWFLSSDAAPAVATAGAALWLVLAVARAAFATAAYDELRGVTPEDVKEVFS